MKYITGESRYQKTFYQIVSKIMWVKTTLFE
jgi:hypothetical protein